MVGQLESHYMNNVSRGVTLGVGDQEPLTFWKGRPTPHFLWPPGTKI